MLKWTDGCKGKILVANYLPTYLPHMRTIANHCLVFVTRLVNLVTATVAVRIERNKKPPFLLVYSVPTVAIPGMVAFYFRIASFCLDI